MLNRASADSGSGFLKKASSACDSLSSEWMRMVLESTKPDKHIFTRNSLKASALFSTPPSQWGLRGDPFLWREMREYFRSLPVDVMYEGLQETIEKAFIELTGHDMAGEESFFIERFSHGGMSSGHIDPESWRTTIVDVLASRLEELKKIPVGKPLPTLKILTWNCHEKDFGKYMPLCEQFDADVMVIPESRRPAENIPDCLWVGSGKRGLAIVARNGYSVHSYALDEDLPSYYLMASVEGHGQRFNLLGVWTRDGAPRYIQGAHQVLDNIKESFLGPDTSEMIMVGDFNSNTIWDKLHGSRCHSAFIGKLRDDHMMASSYHHFNNESHGSEVTPTYYHQYKLEQPFHIDYCFAPLEWCDRIVSIHIGSANEWLKNSDHMPLVVEYALLPW